jgi:surface polysaccharide O-acyltransferase-like enzyme
MLSDTRPFDAKYYVSRRLGKVLIPFIIWSIFYVYLSGWTANGYQIETSIEVLANSYNHATYYHLGFFYYFIPLYFVIPFFQILVKKADDITIYGFLIIWLITTGLYLVKIDGPWSHQLWLYSGYLLLGYVLYQKIPMTRLNVLLFVAVGALGCLASVGMVVSESLTSGQYTVGRWLSYKTLNTVAAASMVFMLCRYFGEGLKNNVRLTIGFVSKYSLGIYILHPIFLWPMKEFGWYQGHPLIVIPIWIILSGAGALFLSWLLSRNSRTAWLLP